MRTRHFYLIAMLLMLVWPAMAQTITTIAGGPNSGDSVLAGVGYIKPYSMTRDTAGNLFVVDYNANLVKKISVHTGLMTRFAGTGVASFSGDGGPAVDATFYGLGGIAADIPGNIYLTDYYNHRIRKVSTDGIISSIAGNGFAGFNGDGIMATDAKMSPIAIAVDDTGNIYFTDDNVRVRKISGGIITTVAGNGISGYTGDGGPATDAQIALYSGICIGNDGSILLGGGGFDLHLRKIDNNGIITTIAGTGGSGYTGDGGPATAAQINIEATGIIMDDTGNIYISHDGAIRKINTSGVINTVAGHPHFGGCADDGEVALGANMGIMSAFAFDDTGHLLIACLECRKISKIDGAGILRNVGGNGLTAYTGDGGPASMAVMQPVSVLCDTGDSYYITDFLTREVRKVTADGYIHRIAGGGAYSSYVDIPATTAAFSGYIRVSQDNHNNLYVVDNGNNCIRKITPDGMLHAYAGTVSGPSYSGDGGLAINAGLSRPYRLATDTAGNAYFTDNYSKRVRKVNAAGIITTFAGTGVAGYSGDGGPATAARLTYPLGIDVDKNGNVYFGDSSGIRKVSTDGIITMVVPNHNPSDLKIDDTGGIFAAEERIYYIDTSGGVHVYAGDGAIGFGGDGGPAVLATFFGASSFDLDQHKNMFIGDYGNNRVRFVCAADSIVASASISSSATIICPGTLVNFSSSTTNIGSLRSYQWQKNGVAITGATSSTYTSSTLSDADVINCIVTSLNPQPCLESAVVTSNSITLTVLPISPTPSSINITSSPASVSYAGEPITYTATFLNGGTSPTFQWYINGIAVPGAVSNPFITTSVTNGDHVSVTVHTSNPCATPDSAHSSDYIIGVGVAQINSNSVSIDLFPNPNHGTFRVRGYFGSANMATIEVSDMMGKVVYASEATLLTGRLDEQMQLGSIAPGVYFIKIRDNERINNYKFIVR